MSKKLFFGAGGPDEPIQTSDNLKSEDVVEFALAVSEGPIRGLTNGAKSFYVGDTPLVNEAGSRNFDKFAIGVHPGFPEGSARPLELKLGGITSSTQVGITLLQNTAVTRQTESSLRGTIDELEVRIFFSRLALVNEDGEFYNDARFRLEYKKVNDLTWLPFDGEVGAGGVSDVVWIPHTGGDAEYTDTLVSYLVTVGAEVTKGQVIAKIQEGRFNYGETPAQTDVKATITGQISELPLTPGAVIDAWNTTVAKISVNSQTPNGEMVINGKTTVGYVKEFRATVPRLADDDWEIRITKISPDNDPSNVVDMSWESFQCTNRAPATYHNVAIVHGLGVANGQFSSIPEFSGVYDGLIIRVPTNYNPDLRTYDESTPWDGSFKFAWTNNPAWILYDLITNTRYGLAKHRRYIDANRFAFYEAAKWCDTPVLINDGPDTRPRYTFNDVITEQRPALEMLQYVAGSFNALVWDDLQGQIHLRIDKDDPAVMLFTPENVQEDGFQYTFTDITTRANDISVSFINPDLDWAEDRRRISNVTTSEEDIEKHGRIPLDFIAVGCTNVHEAVAKAQVRLISALTETTMVSFTTTRLGALVSLYDVILVADPMMGWSLSGRMKSYDSSFVYLRDAIYIETIKDYVLKVQTQTGIVEVTVEPESIGHIYRLKLKNSTLPVNLPRYAVFTMEETGGYGLAKPFRVLGIEEVDGSPYLYRISAMEINRNKYLLSETNTPIDEPDYSYTQPFLPGRPSNFKASSGDEHLLVLPSGEVVSRIFCSWRKPFGSVVKEYELQWKLLTEEAWQSVKTNRTEHYVSPVTPGAHYSLRVAAIDPDNRRSGWVTIADYTVVGKQKIPANVTSFTATGDIFQILLDWVYSSAPDIKKVEIWASTTNLLSSATKLADLSYPTDHWVHMGLNINVTIYYWIRVQDTSGNYSSFSTPARSATTVTDPTRILDILEGQINELALTTNLNTRINLVDGPVSLAGSVAAQVHAEAVARENAITNLTASVNDADSSLQFQINTLNSEVDANSAAIANESITRADADTALSGQYNTLSSTVSGHSATIQNHTESINGVYAEQFIKTDVDGFVSGYGLASNAQSSIFLVKATNFAFGLPGQTSQYPFMIGLVNGVQTVGVNGALVIDGTLVVREANIVDANITTLKIAGDAVTVPLTVNNQFGAGRNGTGLTNWHTISKGRVSMTQSGILYAHVTISQNYGFGIRTWFAKLLIDGETFVHIGGEVVETAPSMSASVAVAAGEHTVEVIWSGQDDGVRVYTTSLYMQGTKR